MDASSPTALLKLVLPKTPMLLRMALWHTLSMSPTSSKWDLRTELTINMLREMLGPNSTPQPIGKMQRLTCKDPGVKGKIWASKVKIEVPEDDARQMLFKAIEDMGTGEEQWERAEQRPLEAEWNGYRANVKDDEPEPADMNEKEKYKNLIQETKTKVTVLYFHGGAMYLLDPATYRGLTGRLAQQTGGRVFNVRYRLCPQGPFPGALLDCFTAYLSLLSPPPGAPHDPVPASEIVFGGDSAGGLCCAALLQLLLQLHRSTPAGQTPTVRFHGKDVAIPLPAGVAFTSPWLDITRGLPSIENGTKYDYLPTPSSTETRDFPPEKGIWPASPPRADLYCESSALLHPLVSPLAAPDWSGSPPLFFSVGHEMLRDEDAVLAQRAAAQGVPIVWREFEAMPHCFAMLLEALPESNLHREEYAAFCTKVVQEPAHVKTGAVLVKARSLQRLELDGKTGLTEITDKEAREYMQKGKERIESKFRRGMDPAAERPML